MCTVGIASIFSLLECNHQQRQYEMRESRIAVKLEKGPTRTLKLSSGWLFGRT